jgi:PleD family two-component response regulator
VTGCLFARPLIPLSSARHHTDGVAGRPHVLVVDDDARILAALKRALHYEGYSVEVAEDGPGALARAAGLPGPPAGRPTWSCST